jgi:glycosyltransferase involved in cell wall biosynthesis
MQTVKRAIDSAFQGGASEVIVVNDGSADGTGALIDALRDAYAPDTYKALHTGALFPAGVCHARNMAIARAKYDAIIPLDADDYFIPNGIEILYQRWSGPMTLVYANHFDGVTMELKHAPPPERLSQKNLTGATYLFSREMWQKVGGYHPDFNLGCEDWALMCALVSAGVKAVRVEDKCAYIYTPGGSRAKRCIQYADALWQLLREHYPAVFNAQQGR